MDPVPLSPSHRQQRLHKWASGPAGNKKAHLAADVYTFFEDNDNNRRCKLCL
jgi:hypothetical protein